MSAAVWIYCDECGEKIDLGGSAHEARSQINREGSGTCSETVDLCSECNPAEPEGER